MLASKDVRRMSVDRREWTNYRVKCPACGETIGPRHAIREYLDVPPDPPYAVMARCPRSKDMVFIEFTAPA